MDPTRNPFNPGAGSPPPALVGRADEIEAIRIAIERLRLGRPARSMVLTGLLDEDLAGLFTEVGHAARERGKGVLFTLDEVQYLKQKDLGALIVGLHQISQNQLPVLLAAAGLPSVPALAGEAKSCAERLFDFRTINSLSDIHAGAALVEPAEQEGVVWQEQALGRIVRHTKGYPYFLQEFGKQAWDVAEGPGRITEADVEAAIPLAIDELDTGFFHVRVDRTTNAEREYLVAMALLGKGPHPSGRVAAAMGKDTPGVGALRHSLIEKGLCYSPRYGEIDFTVPLFDDFVRRRLRPLTERG